MESINCFKDWVMEDQKLAKEEQKELRFNIQLEQKIEKEKQGNVLRRSERIREKNLVNDIREQYEAYLATIESVRAR